MVSVAGGATRDDQWGLCYQPASEASPLVAYRHTDYFRQALIAAAGAGHSRIVEQLLLRREITPCHRGQALAAAAGADHSGIVERLLREEIDRGWFGRVLAKAINHPSIFGGQKPIRIVVGKRSI